VVRVATRGVAAAAAAGRSLRVGGSVSCLATSLGDPMAIDAAEPGLSEPVLVATDSLGGGGAGAGVGGAGVAIGGGGGAGCTIAGAGACVTWLVTRLTTSQIAMPAI